MMRSMFAGVSGLRTHQTRMDIVGNNIANVNTYGFKSSRASFQEMLSQTIQGASAPTETVGGTNPQQVGLGVQLGSIDVMHSQGNTESTGNTTDLAIEGDGFFILSQGDQDVYTRAGMFGLDETIEGSEAQATGNLVSKVNGMRVMGYRADGEGNIDTNQAMQPIYIPTTDTINPQATDRIRYSGNLDAREGAETISRSVNAYDSKGNRVPVEAAFRQENGEWGYHLTRVGSFEVYHEDIHGNEDPFDALDPGDLFFYDENGEFETVTGTEPSLDGPSVGSIAFDNNGSYESVDPVDTTFTFDFGGGSGVDPLEISLDFSDFTNYAEESTAAVRDQNGYASGSLESYTIDQRGVITGSYSNGLTRPLGQVGMARFPNAAGLNKDGETMFSESSNSGQAMLGTAGTGGFGDIAPSSLEMSNVDLSQEFTNMIITQRGFQANSRTITSSDEMLQELVNLKR